jgi:hypothetical protein
MPAAEPPASSALGKALPGIRRGLPPFAVKEKMKASPPCGEGSLREKASPLAERKWRAREGSGPVPKDKTSGRVDPARITVSPPPPPPGNVHVTDLQKTSLPRQAW